MYGVNEWLERSTVVVFRSRGKLGIVVELTSRWFSGDGEMELEREEVSEGEKGMGVSGGVWSFL